MSSYFPKNREEFLRINGVGQQKLNDFGESFLKLINDYLRENNIVPEKNIGKSQKKRARHLSSNYQKTKGMILKRLSIDEIAKVQKLKERRIIYHIEKLIDGGEKIDINYLFPSKEKFEILKSAFEKIGLERLSPIYNYFEGKYSYEEIRLVKMIMISEKNSLKSNVKTNYHKRLEQIKEGYPNAYDPWEEEEDNKLKNLYLKNISINEIAQILKRQPSAIKSRLKKQGLD